MKLSKNLILICLISFIGRDLHAQAAPTASSDGNLQIGITFSIANPDYTQDILRGVGGYSTFDFTHHIGVEAEFHQLNDSNATVGIYERTYEIGPRYVLRYGKLSPYAKVLYGRGVFNYPPVFGDPNGGSAANLAYNLLAGGFGVDYRIRPAINLRADCEFQRWLGFPPNGLTPSIFGIGVAYHFH